MKDKVTTKHKDHAQTKSDEKKTEQEEDLCSKKVYDELYDKFLRLQAEFDNYRKRVAREKKEYRTFANEKLINDLLPVLDHMELALKHTKESEAAEALSEGIELVVKQFFSVLGKYGLQPIDAEGKPFDPQYHDALIQVETEEHDDNMVIQEHQRGYLLDGRTIRPSRVSVSRRAQPKQDPGNV